MRQSPIRQLLVDRVIEFIASDETLRRADSCSDTLRESLYLRDRSVLRKWTLCGKGASEWLSQRAPVPPAVGDVARLGGGNLIAKVGLAAYFLESDWNGGATENLRRELSESPTEGVYAFPDERASFELGGAQLPEVMQQTCSFDTRREEGQLIMTIVAGVSCHLLCSLTAEHPRILMWTDPSYAQYLWCKLETICRELTSR